MPYKIREQSPAVRKSIMLDTNTVFRFKALAGTTPVARYLRQLSQELSEDVPPPLLTGGNNLLSIRKSVEKIFERLDIIGAKLAELDVKLDACLRAETVKKKGRLFDI